MKKICISILWIAMTINGFSQANIFLRVYNADGNKIAKGHFNGTSDSSLLLSIGETVLEINYTRIGFIKTKHSTGHNILVTGAVLGIVGAIIGIASHKNSSTTSATSGPFSFNFQGLSTTKEQDASFAFFAGAITGSAIGGIAGGLKKVNTYLVNTHFEDWKKVRLKLDNYSAIRKAKTVN